MEEKEKITEQEETKEKKLIINEDATFSAFGFDPQVVDVSNKK